MGKWINLKLPLHLNECQTPREPCVYVVYFGSEPVYVGQTRNFGGRMAEHKFKYGYDGSIKTPWGSAPKGTSITVKISRSFKYGDWAMREIRLIKRIQPRYNCHHKKSGEKACITISST